MENSPPPASKGRRPAYRQIAESLRNEILKGKREPGSRLPSTGELAAIWKASDFTVYTALQLLVKEGWIERLHGEGSYVADPKSRFTCAGIYHSTDIFADEQRSFSRRLNVSLLKQFARLKIDTQIFIDSRTQTKQETILPSLADALLHRRIQCLIAPTLNHVDSGPLARLALPTAFMTNPLSPHQTEFDVQGLLRESVRRLAAQGCRSIGIISHILEDTAKGNPYSDFYSSLQKAAHAEGLAMQKDWIRKPKHSSSQLETLGYREFKKLWHLRQKPDGLIVYPDTVVRGIITAILEIGIREVSPRMKFVFHRNAHATLLCPFPVTWAISDEDLLAEELIRSIERQFRGESVSPNTIPHSFVKNEP